MSNEPNANYSDLEAARQLSMRLQNGTAPASNDLDSAGVSEQYVRFSVETVAHPSIPTPSPLSEAAESDPPKPSGSFGPRYWQDLLEWSIQQTDGIWAVVVDESGLVIVNRGDMSTEIAGAVGSRLMIMLDQAELLEPEGGGDLNSFAVQYDNGWLTIMRLRFGEEGRLTLGIYGAYPLSAPQQLATSKVLADL